ncbi:MAG: BlaI/MecI/CopY family transcriptional regulator [Fimbriimonadaceae bacterium]|nr:BlaI/MecI/CopY family transcriptional regulator [Fimbriimonadaceae bacterium]
MRKLAKLGKLEFEVLRFLVTRGPSTVGEVAGSYGEEQGYARTTVQTVMERLRKKGFLDREIKDGTYAYFSKVPASAFFLGVVKDFVRESLSHDTSPIVAYLAQSKGLTAEEEAVLRKLAMRVEEEGSDD